MCPFVEEGCGMSATLCSAKSRVHVSETPHLCTRTLQHVMRSMNLNLIHLCATSFVYQLFAQERQWPAVVKLIRRVPVKFDGAESQLRFLKAIEHFVLVRVRRFIRESVRSYLEGKLLIAYGLVAEEVKDVVAIADGNQNREDHAVPIHNLARAPTPAAILTTEECSEYCCQS